MKYVYRNISNDVSSRQDDTMFETSDSRSTSKLRHKKEQDITYGHAYSSMDLRNIICQIEIRKAANLWLS
jgi:hypothetical protein